MTAETIHQYSLFVDFLAQTLGPDYEIVLHDLERSHPSIVAIANGHVSGRSVGGPITNLAVRIIAEKVYETKDYILNYRGQTDSGKVLRCSTFFLKNENGRLAGLLCINFDDSRYRELSERVFRLCHPDAYVQHNIQIESVLTNIQDENLEQQETFYQSITSATKDAIKFVMHGRVIASERLTLDEKLEIVSMLNDHAIFMLKGAVTEVAKELACSPASIYRYLAKLNSTAKKKLEKLPGNNKHLL